MSSKHGCADNLNKRLKTTESPIFTSGIIPSDVARVRGVSAVYVHLVPTLTVWRANAGSNSNNFESVGIYRVIDRRCSLSRLRDDVASRISKPHGICEEAGLR